ncbi:Carbohydrate kinase, FGGY family [hydrothermal vent metagenome]|uniref:Carbohydrate kinase, FGGY family n=1 Tax=hydrothermal vent metagenome TaxID=652676 RepID=A0A3B1AMX4_9ZZZZ
MVIDAANTLIAQQAVSLPPPVQNGRAIEQNAEIWWQALSQLLIPLFRQIKPDKINALSVDATSGTVLLCDHEGQPLHPALMYHDVRATAEAAHILNIAPVDAAAASTPSSGLAKLLWLQKQSYSNNARYFLHQADWITGKLGGCFGHSDFNNALKSGYNASSQSWPKWLDALAVKRDWLPQVQTPGRPLMPVAPDIAREFGFNKNCLLVTGTTDSTAAFLATGAHQLGDAVTALGSTLVLKIISKQPIAAAEFGIYSQPLPYLGKQKNPPLRWLCGGASNSGGAVLRQFFNDSQMAQMQTQLDPDTPTGLDYYPLPRRGERFPVNDPDLEPRLTPATLNQLIFFQAMLEGLSRIEKDGYDKLTQCGAPAPKRIYSTGGGVQNPAWRKIRGQLIGLPIVDAVQNDAAFGAALLARQGWQNVPSQN